MAVKHQSFPKKDATSSGTDAIWKQYHHNGAAFAITKGFYWPNKDPPTSFVKLLPLFGQYDRSRWLDVFIKMNTSSIIEEKTSS